MYRFSKKGIILLLILIGSLIGMILLCVYYDEFKLQGYFLEPYFFQNIQNIKEDKRALTLLCIKERIGALFLIFFLSKKIWLRKIIYIYLLLFGVVLGIIKSCLLNYQLVLVII